MKAIKTITILALFIIGSSTAGNTTGFTHNMVSAQKMLKMKKGTSVTKSDAVFKSKIENSKKEKTDKEVELVKSVSLNNINTQGYTSSVLSFIISSVIDSAVKSGL